MVQRKYRDRHYTLICATIEYHTDRRLHVIRNVQGQTYIKVNFNFVQGQTDGHLDKTTLWIIELLTSQLKVVEG